MPNLRLDGVTRRFSGLIAVNGVTFDVPPGEITGLIGPNGAGKSTVVNLITGMLALSEGRITLDGEEIGAAPPHKVARKGIARTFQNIRLIAEASVLENVRVGAHRHEEASLLAGVFGLGASRADTAAADRAARDLLARFGMERFADHPAGGLAYGHQRRVEMMRALASRPGVLLLDEPVAGMNDVESDALAEIFESLAAEGMAVLLIEHNIRFVTRLCRKIHVLDSGRLIASGPPEEVMHDPAVVAAYVGRGADAA